MQTEDEVVRKFIFFWLKLFYFTVLFFISIPSLIVSYFSQSKEEIDKQIDNL